ncbi:hypothetical protein ASPCADRAFT_6350 [Aspergillus carbonarius ITEM 5010]|uniref:Uncharacterized protein n=1 Tax=Aspergillus carbonarius (strain ITEM 5010) TaxID=602072 RepID=A0A1R3RJL2_ASPC5|nr:hypothetical protein ASPCADRAFT_6350 [Aspergillus carbonarius ITEM 5010]
MSKVQVDKVRGPLLAGDAGSAADSGANELLARNGDLANGEPMHIIQFAQGKEILHEV